jgi:hypothetical protein
MNSVELLLILVQVWKYGSKNLRRNSVPKEFRSHPRGDLLGKVYPTIRLKKKI